MRRKIGLLVIISLVFFTTGVFGAGLPSFPMDAGVIILEENSGDILYQQKQDDKFYPASTTKLMTALVAVENGNLSESFTLGSEITDIDADSSVAGLEVGKVMTLKELLYALLLPSGNDAAKTVAVNIGRKIAGNDTLDAKAAEEKFIEAMNKRAASLDMKGTHFVNAHGLHNLNHYSTPGDMLKLAKVAFNNDGIREITRTKYYNYKTDTVKHEWINTNLMIYSNYDILPEDYRVANDLSGTNPNYNQYATSGKTGFTEEAGRCLVFEGEGEGKNVIGIIMNSDESVVFEEANKTLQTLIKEYDFVKWTGDDDFYKEIEIENYHIFDGKNLGLKTDSPLVSLAPKGNENPYTAKIKWDDALVKETEVGTLLEGDVNEGDALGEIQVYNEEALVEATPIYAINKMKARSWLDYPILYWYVTIAVVCILLATLRIMYVDFMRKNRIKYKKIKVGNKSNTRQGNTRQSNARQSNARQSDARQSNARQSDVRRRRRRP